MNGFALCECDLVELTRELWRADATLQGLLSADKVYDSTAFDSPTAPYVVLADLGETDRSAYGPMTWGVTWTVRARIYHNSKAEAIEIADALRKLVVGCHERLCLLDTYPVLWGRVTEQPRGYVAPALFMVQQLLQWKVILF